MRSSKRKLPEGTDPENAAIAADLVTGSLFEAGPLPIAHENQIALTQTSN